LKKSAIHIHASLSGLPGAHGVNAPRHAVVDSEQESEIAQIQLLWRVQVQAKKISDAIRTNARGGQHGVLGVRA